MTKPLVAPCLLGALALPLLAPNANAQATIFTDPSGYTTVTAVAAVDASTPKYSFVSHSLAQKRKVAATVTGVGADTLTVTGAGFDDYATAPHYVHITSGARKGDLIDIANNTSEILTLTGAGDLSGMVDETITIYQHNTLASVFGADPRPDGFLGGDNTSEANLLLFYVNNPTPAADSYVTYYYNDDTNPFIEEHIGWVDAASDTVPAEDTIIRPNQGFIILNRSTTAYSKTVFGDVITSDITLRIAPDGYNLVTVPYPVPPNTTLADTGLYPADPIDFDINFHLKAGPNSSVAEKVLIWNGSGYDTYFVNDDDGAPFFSYHLGWVNAANQSVDASATVIPAGGFFILRHDGSPPIDWIFPNVVTE